MPSTPRTLAALSTLALVAVAGGAEARSVIKQQAVQVPHMAAVNTIGDIDGEFGHLGGFSRAPDFSLTGKPVGAGTPPATSQPGGLHGSNIAVLDGDVLVVDADSGELIRTTPDGNKVASLALGSGASQLVLDADAKKVYVADRSHDRVVVVDVSDGLTEVDAFRTAVEPFGLALSPDRKTLLVTSVADKTLAAIELDTGFEQWSMTVGPEPRGVAFSPSGKEALVTFLTTGVVGRVSFAQKTPSIDYVSLDPAAPQPALNGSKALSGDEGRSFVRNAFAAVYAGNDVAVVPHQLSVPQSANADELGDSGGYGGGGGFAAPITHRLAFLGMPDEGEAARVDSAFALTSVHQPRAAAYHAASDTMFVVGFGSDDVLAVSDVSQASVHLAWKAPVPAPKACGPNGVAFDEGADELVVFCSLSRTTHRMAASTGAQVRGGQSPELAKSTLSASAQRGQEIFRRGNSQRISTGGVMACASCHAEGRADGLTWFLTGNILQTPFLSGRVMGSHPFKWDGKDATLTDSLTNTVGRLGGTGLSKTEVKDLTAFLAALPAPRTPSAEEPAAVARGRQLFESDATGCADCHNGPLLTDQNAHPVAPDLPEVDTPSLIGLASSAPYYHDGSAPTLEALLRGKGNIHGMGRLSKLDDGEIGDLVAYMESL
ncbi:MAG: c-type cytochrome [Nannocystaceae bacterium]|nr:c-type cytochrome [bacterium]